MSVQEPDLIIHFVNCTMAGNNGSAEYKELIAKYPYAAIYSKRPESHKKKGFTFFPHFGTPGEIIISHPPNDPNPRNTKKKPIIIAVQGQFGSQPTGQYEAGADRYWWSLMANQDISKFVSDFNKTAILNPIKKIILKESDYCANNTWYMKGDSSSSDSENG